MPTHVSAGGNAAYVSPADADQVAALDEHLKAKKLSGLVLWGDGPLWLGVTPCTLIACDVKTALDPDHRFPGLYD